MIAEILMTQNNTTLSFKTFVEKLQQQNKKLVSKVFDELLKLAQNTSPSNLWHLDVNPRENLSMPIPLNKILNELITLDLKNPTKRDNKQC